MTEERAVQIISDELKKAEEKFGPMRSMHEGYAIILEEMDELWYAIKRNQKEWVVNEAAHVAAMAFRF